jgi:hypothetical protein
MKDADHFAVWGYLLLNATHAEYSVLFKGKRTTLKSGQLLTGRKSISSTLSINESKVTRILKLFENEHQIEQQTSNQNRLISIVNWDCYQSCEQQIEQQVNNERTTSEQQVNTNKNVKNDNNDKNVRSKDSCQQIVDLYNSTCVSLSAVKSLSDQRRKAIKARLNTYKLDDFKTLFEMAESSSFLKGSNDRNWTATFDWLIKDSNMAKVLDGNYVDKKRYGRTEQKPNWMQPSLETSAAEQNAFQKILGGNFEAEAEKARQRLQEL